MTLPSVTKITLLTLEIDWHRDKAKNGEILEICIKLGLVESFLNEVKCLQISTPM